MNPMPLPHAAPRHRAGRPRGRPVAELLAALPHPRPADAWNTGPRHAAPLVEPAKLPDAPAAAASLGLDITELNGLDVFAAASIVRRRARAATTRLYRARPRLRRARRVTGIALDSSAPGGTSLTSTVTEHVLALEIAETRLVTGLDKLEATLERARAARRDRSMFYPHGGRLVISGPMHERLAQRLELAENTADALHTIARRNVRLLVRQIAVTELFATSLEQFVEDALDQAAAAAAAALGDAPPPILSLLRATLPAQDRHDWWREICALFAEATPAERRQACRSLLLNAPQTLWTTWTIRARTPDQHPGSSGPAAHPPETAIGIDTGRTGL